VGLSSVVFFRFPPGLEDVSKIRYLLETLWATGKWTEEELEKMASKNILRVFSQVEEVCKQRFIMKD
jgi:microsomal dipeptidase-like Zn-dependent dipeptidase